MPTPPEPQVLLPKATGYHSPLPARRSGGGLPPASGKSSFFSTSATWTGFSFDAHAACRGGGVTDKAVHRGGKQGCRQLDAKSRLFDKLLSLRSGAIVPLSRPPHNRARTHLRIRLCQTYFHFGGMDSSLSHVRAYGPGSALEPRCFSFCYHDKKRVEINIERCWKL